MSAAVAWESEIQKHMDEELGKRRVVKVASKLQCGEFDAMTAWRGEGDNVATRRVLMTTSNM